MVKLLMLLQLFNGSVHTLAGSRIAGVGCAEMLSFAVNGCKHAVARCRDARVTRAGIIIVAGSFRCIDASVTASQVSVVQALFIIAQVAYTRSCQWQSRSIGRAGIGRHHKLCRRRDDCSANQIEVGIQTEERAITIGIPLMPSPSKSFDIQPKS